MARDDFSSAGVESATVDRDLSSTMSIAPDNWIPRHRINVDEYYRMSEVGLLTPDARVELIEGEVIDMAPIGGKHAAMVDALGEILRDTLGKQVQIAIQRPIRLSKQSEPQPDLALLKRRSDYYGSAHPSASDVLLIVEVSDTTLRYDRDIKAPLYARHAIPETWLIDLPGRQLHCLREPRDGNYSSAITLQSGHIAMASLPDLRIDLSTIFNF